MLYKRYPALEKCREEIEKAVSMLIGCYENQGKLLICGNGGSCADSDHIVGELMKGFMLQRRPDRSFTDKLISSGISEDEANMMTDNLQGALPAISLPAQSALISAFSNDVEPEMVYAQMALGYGNKGDALLCLSTSGNSKNVVAAAKVGKALGLATIAMTGERDSALSRICDVTIQVPETETYKVQELHLPVYHYICAKIEEYFFGE